MLWDTQAVDADEMSRTLKTQSPFDYANHRNLLNASSIRFIPSIILSIELE